MKRISLPCRSRAFTFAGLLIIIAVLAILAAMLLPALAKAKARAQRIRCMNNLKQCGLAFLIWSGDHEDHFPMAVATNKHGTQEWVDGGNAFRHFQALSNELNTPRVLVCPSDTRPPAANFIRLQNQNLSYFVGLDASEKEPAGMLSGDRNITNGLTPVRAVLLLPPDRPWGFTETMHRQVGNIGYVDGHVEARMNTAPGGQWQRSANFTNRIALPE